MSDTSISQVDVAVTTALSQQTKYGLSTFASVIVQAATQSTAPQSTGAPQRSLNALDVLFSALPTDVAASIASEYGISLQIGPTDTPATSMTGSMVTSSVSSSSASTTSLSTMSETTTTSSRTPPTLSSAIRTPTTLSGAASATSTNAPTRDSQFQSGAVAGITTGVTAAVVLIILAALLLCRRRQQGKPLLRRSRSRGSHRVYPEVAWLYDPQPTPPRTPTQHSRGNESKSGRSLLPGSPRPSGSMETAAVYGRLSTNMLQTGSESPLLLPRPTSSAYGHSPYGSPHGSPHYSPRGSPELWGQYSPAHGRRWSARSSVQSSRPMYAIYEEAPRGD